MKGHEKCANTPRDSHISPFLKRPVRASVIQTQLICQIISNCARVDRLFKIGLSAVAEANTELLEPPLTGFDPEPTNNAGFSL